MIQTYFIFFPKMQRSAKATKIETKYETPFLGKVFIHFVRPFTKDSKIWLVLVSPNGWVSKIKK